MMALRKVDPVFVASCLAKCKSSGRSDNLARAAAAFAQECPEGQKSAAMRKLASGHVPAVRLVGGIHLLSVGDKKGQETLRKLAADNSNAAEFANFVLASYGDKSRMPRAIQAIGIAEQINSDFAFRQIYSTSVLVVLSNAANGSGLPQPNIQHAQFNYAEQLWKDCNNWWNIYGDRVALFPVGTTREDNPT